MKDQLRRIGVCLLIFCLMSGLFGCAEPAAKKDENCFTWDPVEGVLYYEYTYSAAGIMVGSRRTDSTSVRWPEGCFVEVVPVMADGSRGDVIRSESNGEPKAYSSDELIAFFFQIDGSGTVTWEPEYGAIHYECKIVGGGGVCIDEMVITEPSASIPRGTRMEMRPVYGDGSYGSWMTSATYGDQEDFVSPWGDQEIEAVNPVDPRYSIMLEDLNTVEVISAIRWDTVKTDKSGLMTFEADGPHGVMRFEALGVTAGDGQLTFQPGARLRCLDALGRICFYDMHIADTGSPENQVLYSGGYSFDGATSVERGEDLIYIWGLVRNVASNPDGDISNIASVMDYQPNYITVGSPDNSVDDFSLDVLRIYYEETTFSTGIQYIGLWSEFYGTYLAGDSYDPGKEIFDSGNGIYDFYLLVVPELAYEKEHFDPFTEINEDILAGRSLIDLRPDQYTVGELRKPDGTSVSKSAPLEVGYTLDVTVGNYTFPVRLPIYDRFAGGQNMHDLVPYGHPDATGDMNVLVIPVAWQNQAHLANDENRQMICAQMGRVMENGTVNDYSRDQKGQYTLSEYFDIASYGKLEISSYVTDWYVAPCNYSDMQFVNANDPAFLQGLYSWLMEKHPDMDWTKFDLDADGYLDSVVMVNVGQSDTDGYVATAFSGAAHHMLSYNGGNAGTPDKPTINNITNISADLLGGNVMIHEFGHLLGLIDYYDVTYSGIDAVGSFDMQSGNYGDWNPYSKYAAGWIQPTVVEGLASGESVEITIGAFCETGDSIVIPVHDTFDGPFNEYIMVDLFTSGGVNAYDAPSFGLQDAVGVRIYHIDARMEYHEEVVDGISYPLGTPYSVNAYNKDGAYHVELIQAGKKNTFTNMAQLRTQLSAQDLFKAGMSFSVDAYNQFFDDGKMNDGSEFGYTITVVSVSEQEAVIRITAK